MQLNRGESPKDICLPEYIIEDNLDASPNLSGITVNRASVVELIKARIADGTIAGGGGGGAVTSVNTQTGAVVLTKSDIGLANVNNTSDANKPVSTAQAAAIGLKQDTLVSGTNIKTVGGFDITGSGNIAFPSTTNALTSSGETLLSTVNGTASSLIPLSGTIVKNLGFDSSGALVKQTASGGGGSAISQYSAGANVLVTATNTGITATKSSGAWTITVPTGVIPLEVSVDVASTDVNISGDSSGATNWITVTFTGAGISSGATTGTYRFPALQTFLVPSSGAIAATNPIVMSSTAIAVIGATTGSFTFRKANMVVTGEHTILTFTGF